MPFKKKPGVVYVVGDDGYVALNVAGMPVDMFVALTGELGRQIGNTIVRNAKPSDQLGPGAWYVFSALPSDSSAESPDIVYYAHPEAERLTAGSLHDAVMDYLAACVGPELPPAVEIGAFTRSDISFGSLDPLESILEYLHEDYGDPDLAPLGSMTSRMEEAQERFLAVVRQEYVPYTCELAYTTTVDLPAHLTEHVPCSRCGKSFIWREVPDGRPSCPACRQRQ